MNDMAVIFGVMAAVIILIIIIAVAVGAGAKEKVQQLQRYWDVEIGMPEEVMLEIMGGGYNRSLLKNGRTKYEWRINATSYGSSYKGISTRSYSGVKKVTIYTKNGYVEEVKPFNV